MIEVLNTPFDHIERIVLEDFSGTMFSSNGNYFKDLFTFPADPSGKYNGGFAGFTMEDPEGIATFVDEDETHTIKCGVNDIFKSEVNKNIGGFFIDSFTYTPFVDYSQVGEGGDPRIGVYSDTFLNDYNTEKYDDFMLFWHLKNITDGVSVADFAWDSSQGKWISGNKYICYSDSSETNTFEYYEGTTRKASWSGLDSIRTIAGKQYRFCAEKVYTYNQADKNRHKMSSKLYELGNLKKDLEDAKVAFRNAVKSPTRLGNFGVDVWHLKNLTDNTNEINFVWDSTQGKWISGTKSISGSYNEEIKSWKFNYYEGTTRKASWYGFDSIQSVSSKRYRFYFNEFVTQKVYIYTLCEHLAELFAKLSNIRMSHEIYGFKHPHCRWEGILALDVWYNLLYREIDAKYPFDERHLNLNPMQRRKYNGSGSVTMDDGKVLNLRSGGTCRWAGDSEDAPGLEWMTDETSTEYIYIWDANLWKDYYGNSEKITKTRKECTTPRGVLEKVQRIVRELEYKWQYYAGMLKIEGTSKYYNRDSDNDYEWFKQPGKIYTHWESMSQFTKYVNLHLGTAYDVMTGKEYCELTETSGSTQPDGSVKYTKPKFSSLGDGQRTVLDKMVQAGFKALVDAFSVVQNEHLFNVYNSATCVVEEFDASKAKNYSQSQCAIALERVFSRIYKYLQFKSTTGETFQRHINIDSGYKYLTTESLKDSDHKLDIYYDFDEDKSRHIEKHYLRYLKKLNYYLGNLDETPPDIGLTDHERAILQQFCEILSKETLDWLDEKWDLCPLLKHSSDQPGGLSPRKLMARAVGDGDEDNGQVYSLCIEFRKNGSMNSGWNAR